MKPEKTTFLENWVDVGWLLLGLFALAFGAFLFLLMEPVVRLWWYADRYVMAELEAREVRQIASGRRQGAMTIEGVIHPFGEPVVVAGHTVLPYLEGTPFGVPAPAEIEGRRLPVLYWPNQEERWWHPPHVVKPGATQRTGVVAGAVLSWVALGGLATYCFRRAYWNRRSHRSAAAAAGGPGG